MTLEYIEALETNNELEAEIKEIIISNVERYENPIDFFTDLENGGCVNGQINELYENSDTSDFCKRHAEDINKFLFEILEMTGVDNIQDLFGDKFDHTDFFCLGSHNKNIISWYVFEGSCDLFLRNYRNEQHRESGLEQREEEVA